MSKAFFFSLCVWEGDGELMWDSSTFLLLLSENAGGREGQ